MDKDEQINIINKILKKWSKRTLNTIKRDVKIRAYKTGKLHNSINISISNSKINLLLLYQ